MDSMYTCYDCVQYEYENDMCKLNDFVEAGDGICEDFTHVSEGYASMGYEDDGYPD